MTGQLGSGSRLLATRALADELGVARNTVLYAYEQLATEGLTRGTPRGSLVMAIAPSDMALQKSPLRANEVARRVQRVRSLPASGPEAGAFVPGVPALDLFPAKPWRRILDQAWRDIDPSQLNYPDVAGLPALREEIRHYLMASRGTRCSAEQIFVTSGTQASLAICARTFADAGATGWIENPGYIGALAAFRSAQLRTIGIGVDAEGIRPSSQDWNLHRPKLIYTTPSHQYPTGGVLCMTRRLALIEQAATAGALIIEDDYDSEFRYDGPPMAAMQGLVDDAPVIYVGTFSKTMFPAIRTGFMIVPKNLVAPLRLVLARASPHGRTTDQMALASFLEGGQFGVHLRRMRRVYRGRRDVLVNALRTHLGQFGQVHGETAGLHMALQFAPGGPPDTGIARAALEQGVVVRALSAHSTGLREHGWNGLMFGFSQLAETEIEMMVERLARVVDAGA